VNGKKATTEQYKKCMEERKTKADPDKPVYKPKANYV
jgi:hypothetical protein